MDLLYVVKSYLSNSGIESGIIHLDAIPSEPPKAVALYEYGSSVPSPQIAGAVRSVQFVARDKTATAAKQMAWAMFKALDSEEGIVALSPERHAVVELKQVPFKLKVDTAGGVSYAFNANITTYIG